MGLEYVLSCAMCGKQKTVAIDTSKVIPSLDDAIKPWIVQQNGQHTDIYCSKPCAR